VLNSAPVIGSDYTSELLARVLHSIFSIVKEQSALRIADFQFRTSQFEIRNPFVELIGIFARGECAFGAEPILWS
jgi:hypothetical protein